MAGTLVLCATPIGNLGDLSERTVEALSGADVIFAEDTRRTGRLLTHIGASVPMKSFFAHNEKSRLRELAVHLEQGHTVVVVSDAGMPVVSDPGMSAVGAAIGVGAVVTVLPGPSAVVTALAVSGFDGDRFVFEGFLPRKGKARSAVVEAIGAEQRTVVLFAAPGRVVRDLEDLSDHMEPDRRIVLARELTKLHEEIWRGTLAEAISHWGDKDNIRGEFTVVIRGAKRSEPDMQDALEAAKHLIDQGFTTSDAVRQIAASTGVSRRELYDLVVKQYD
ncbi:MAG: 16S rRNA (cytidine(1402)-2'-O)-methyltransferase [Actinobacteria bacterium]|nr:MAG: 16S rRNA (cytidine(1402)-2'-O)-methyltransferase [Actinomycetota bacterium]